MLRVAVAGTAFGSRIHVPALRAAGFEVVALVGSDAERTARRAGRLGIPLAATSLEEALAVGPDAVSIATPPDTHFGLARRALEAGCHVLCEKPFTRDAAEAVELEALARSTGRVGVIGHEFRWAPDRALAARALRDGRVGVPRLVVLVSMTSLLREFRMSDWWYDGGRAGGWLGASGSHLVDQVRTWLGEFEAVSASLADLGGIGVDDTFAVRFRLTSGAEGSLVQAGSAWGPSAGMTRVVGTGGTLWVDGGAVLLADQDHPQGMALAVPEDLVLPEVEVGGALAAMTKMELPPYIRLARAFREAIEEGAASGDPGPATFSDGVAVMAVLDAVRRSAATGGAWVAVPGPTGPGPAA